MFENTNPLDSNSYYGNLSHTTDQQNDKCKKTKFPSKSSICKKEPLVLFPPIVIQKTNMHKLTYH